MSNCPCMVQTGTILAYGGATAPAGYLLCDGSVASRTTYADLYAVVGTSFGPGDGSTTFGLPDLRGRVPAGLDTMGGTAAGRLTTTASGVDGAVLGKAGGAQTHTLTKAELPAHYHTVYPHAGRVQASSGTRGAGSEDPNATSNVDPAKSSTVGEDQPHNNVQPTLVVAYVIKT